MKKGNNSYSFFLFPGDRRSGEADGRDVGFALSVILWYFLILSETLLITFHQWELELRYFTWVFLVTRLFRGYQHFWPCDPFFQIIFINLHFYIIKITNTDNKFTCESMNIRLNVQSFQNLIFYWILHIFKDCNIKSVGDLTWWKML